MIAIVNIGPFDDPDPTGERAYEVRINREVITTFRHHRGDGLATCLKKASKAVKKADNRWLESLPIWPVDVFDMDAVSEAEAVLSQLSTQIKRAPFDAAAILEGVERNLHAAISRRNAEDAARLLYIKTRLSKMIAGLGKMI